MKRKLALILAGCLAISPLSANLTTIQAFAAEHTESEDSRSSLFSVYVSDENGCELDEGAIYPLSAGESRNLTAAIGGDGESSSYFVTWNSEDPEIVSLDNGGSLSALSSGTTKIYLNVSNGSDQYSFCYTVRISEPEISEETEEEVSEEAVDEIETAVEGDPAETEVEPALEAEAKADSAVEAEAEIEPDDDADPAIEGDTAEDTTEADAEAKAEVEPALEAEAEIEPDGAEPAIEDESIKADAEGDSAADDLIADLTEDPMDDSMSVSKTAEMAAVTGEKVTKTGWVNSNGSWSYLKSDGSKATGFLTLGTSTFFLDAQGVMKTGWIKDGSSYYYADPEGRLQSGWQTIDGSIYYLDPKTFARKTGICKIDNKLYAFSADGIRQTGPRWYNSASGKCYVNGNGTLHTGWLLKGGKRYYMASNGIMKAGCKLVLGGKIYFLDKTGAMRTGWYGFSSYLYYLSADGSAVKGWQTIGGSKYFFDGNCLARTGWYKPGNRVYYFGAHGRMQTGITKVDNYVYYLRPDGIVTKGWKKVDGKWYYLNARSRALTGWLTLGDKKYHLARNGVMDTGYKTIGGVRYYFGSDGAMVPYTYNNNNNYSNTEEFIQCIAPLVRKYAPQWNVKVYSPIIAQAILESASGQSSLGKKYNNFFGLKCGTLWTGKSVNLATGEEYTPGTYTTIYANFRVFDSMEEGVRGYFEFLFKDRTRYNNLIGETDPYRYLEKIKDDGYATSSKYVQNTYNVIKSYNLTRFDP